MRNVCTFALALTLCSTAGAAMQRTFVASYGSDSNACSLQQPCRGFAAALLQTNAGGEIVVLDSAGYGAVTIGKAVSIVVPAGVYAGISVFAGNGITVNAGVNDEVILRGLTINAQGGSNGVSFTSGAALHVESCTIRGFVGSGMANLLFAPAGASRLFVKDSFLRGGDSGLALANSALAAAVVVDNTRIENNVVGVKAAFSGRIAIRNTTVAESSGHGLDLQTSGAQSLDVDLDGVLVTGSTLRGVSIAGGAIAAAIGNSTMVRNLVGLYVQGGATPAVARLTNSVVTGNATGMQASGTGSILTPLTNTIEGNGSDGSASGSYLPK